MQPGSHAEPHEQRPTLPDGTRLDLVTEPNAAARQRRLVSGGSSAAALLDLRLPAALCAPAGPRLSHGLGADQRRPACHAAVIYAARPCSGSSPPRPQRLGPTVTARVRGPQPHDVLLASPLGPGRRSPGQPRAASETRVSESSLRI